MIITLTLNPAIDKTVHVPSLVPGGLNRIGDVVENAGGKGVNVSKMVSVLGGQSIATGFCGGSVGQTFLGCLDAFALSHDFVEVAGTTRINTKIIDGTFGLTELNEPGIQVTPQEEERLIAKLLSLVSAGDIFVLSGSLHANASFDFYHVLTQALHECGATVLMDADGPSFTKAITAKPYFIKPNREELKRYCGNADMNDEALFAVCRQLVADGIGLVALSLGSDGAAFFSKDHSYFVPPLKVAISSSVGAGDSMVGAVAYGIQQNMPLQKMIALAVACGTGAVTTKGTTPPTLTLVQQLQEQVTLISL